MIALLQRVLKASVRVEGALAGQCGPGLLVLFCAEKGDTVELAAKLARKTLGLRIFGDKAGRMNRSVRDAGGSMVSQFTLAADCRSGNRPSFIGAAALGDGRALYEAYVEALRSGGLSVETGRFGAHMEVSLVNDGPVTIWLRLPA